jgi:WD40 repeat protein
MYYEDLAISKTRIVSHRENVVKIFCFGHYTIDENSLPVTNELNGGTELHIDQDAYDDGECTQLIKVNSPITSVNLNKDGRYLLLNISMDKPRIELWDLNYGKFE